VAIEWFEIAKMTSTSHSRSSEIRLFAAAYLLDFGRILHRFQF